jgi:uncharacterized DUF497 family protein
LIFAWDEKNRDHISEHNVTPDEAQFVVENAEIPFPQDLGDERLLVWGPTAQGRLLQVIFVLKRQDQVEYRSVALKDWMALESTPEAKIARVIHAMELTTNLKRKFRRRRR